MIRSKTLVVGSAGFIGSRLMKQKRFDECDLKTKQDIRDGVPHHYDKVIFLAADLGQDSYSYNLELFNALVKSFSPKTFVVYTSSAAVYGEHTKAVDEMDGTFPDTPYGKIKLLGERIISDYFERSTILRLSNVVGNGDGHGVSDIFQNGGKTIYGNGEQIRDYIHVEKVVDAILAVEKHPSEYHNQVFNISTGKGQTVNEVFWTYGEGKPKYVPERDYDIEFSVLDNSLATKAGLL